MCVCSQTKQNIAKKIMHAVKDEAPLTATWLFNSVFGWCIVSKFELQ
jgi:hypothetical protein